jgi:hypothetical protein
MTSDTILACLVGAAAIGLIVPPAIAVRRRDRAIDRRIKGRRLAKVARSVGGVEFVAVAAQRDPWADECDQRLHGPGDAGPPPRCYTGINEYRHDADSLAYLRQQAGVGG